VRINEASATVHCSQVKNSLATTYNRPQELLVSDVSAMDN
jgi:hypothetical protein